MNTLTIGQYVINFGETAKIVGFHHITGDPILSKNGIKWLAASDKCEPVADSKPVRHTKGLVTI